MASNLLFICNRRLISRIYQTRYLQNIKTLSNIYYIVKYPRTEFHTSNKNSSLMEFFDDPENWGEKEVKTGRSWNKEELRIKSNVDLHKLWYVLYKEKNMLLTMEEECKRECEIFPSPERIDKVEESMINLDEVINERNRAVHLLETGETGEPPSYMACNSLGQDYTYTMKEWPIPWYLNKKWVRRYFWYYEKDAFDFRKRLREKQLISQMSAEHRYKNYMEKIIRKFPNADLTAVPRPKHLTEERAELIYKKVIKEFNE